MKTRKQQKKNWPIARPVFPSRLFLLIRQIECWIRGADIAGTSRALLRIGEHCATTQASFKLFLLVYLSRKAEISTRRKGWEGGGGGKKGKGAPEGEETPGGGGKEKGKGMREGKGKEKMREKRGGGGV